MSDLVERLRGDFYGGKTIALEAADEIERLRSDLNTSDATAAEFQRMVEADAVELERLRADLQAAQDGMRKGADYYAALEAQYEAAREPGEMRDFATRKVLEYVLFVLTGSNEIKADLCDDVQMAADRVLQERETAAQREAWWREYNRAFPMNLEQEQRHDDLRRLLGLDAGDAKEKS